MTEPPPSASAPRPDHALSFGQAASSYDRYRPSYPPEAVDWALGRPAGRLRVVDLGAGTGILTRVVSRLGHEVVPVEPDEAMRTQLAAATPSVRPLAGSSESIPLPDGSVDAVLAGQAYHWFDPTRAPAEIARVLRPGGVFAAIWNLRDESQPWVARLSEVAHLGDHERAEQRMAEGPLRAAGFGPVVREAFTHSVTHTPQTLVELIKTRSYYLTAPADRQAAVVEGIRNLVATHPDLHGRDSFPLPYRTVVHRCRLSGNTTSDQRDRALRS
ncbi:MAG: class I SAM-dependent methyltransferase [Micromonosporaceae bacterium]|nr:class I SAM-dependent methyltransferase [Micromonosporaceae bacterium]